MSDQTQDDRIKRIVRKHDRYESERVWHKFLLDAFAGTGGFEGKVRMPFASFWGAGADLYGPSADTLTSTPDDEAAIDTYLDRYPREDTKKFARRAAIANYPNPVEPVVEIRLSYLNRKPMTREGAEKLEEGDRAWMQDVDGRGTTWHVMMRSIVQIRASVIGWCPVLFDMKPEPEDEPELSVQRANELGMRPRAIPLFPANLYDWHEDDAGEIEWAKVGTYKVERDDPLADPVAVHCVTLWERHQVTVFELVEDPKTKKETIRSEVVRPNKWGTVPIVIFRAKPAPTDAIRGLPMVGSIAKLAKRLLNYLSELDEHLRGSTFSILQVPTEDADKIGVIMAGTGNALPIKPDASVEYKFISPDTGVPEVYERRIEETKKDVRYLGRTEFTGGNASGQQKSGLSRAFEFENTNRAVADTAEQFAQGEQRALRLVLLMEGASKADADKLRVIPATKFDVEEMAKEIEEALGAKGLGLGATATSEMAKRLVRKLLPNLDEATLAKIDGEIESLATEAEEDRAFERAEMRAGNDEDDEADDDDAGGGGGGPPPRKPAPGQQQPRA